MIVDYDEMIGRGIETEREIQALRSENMDYVWQRLFVVRGRLFDAFLISDAIEQGRKQDAQPVTFGGRL